MGDLERDHLVGTVFAGHRIDAVIGAGGMGTVYRAMDLALERVTALKVIKRTFAGDSPFRRRFITESKLAASVDHPNVIDVFHAGEHDGVLYVTMRLVEGQDLRRTLASAGALDPDIAMAIAGQAAAALDAAHERGLVHRDVKPANVLLGAEAHVFLTDFGLSKRVSAGADDTEPEAAGLVVGTLDYVAPEQIRHDAGPRSDIYSLGCVVFEMLTGSVPFPIDGEERKLWAHLSVPPPTLTEFRPGLPAGFDAVLKRALDKDPERRQESAGQFFHDLEAALRGSRHPAGPPTARVPARRRLPVVAWRTKPTTQVSPETARLVASVSAATKQIRHAMGGDAPSHVETSEALDAYIAAVSEAAASVDVDVAELAKSPPAEVRERLRRELMRGRHSSRALVLSLKDRLLVMQRAERRIEALNGEMQRQLVELDTVAGLAAVWTGEESAADRRVADRLADLRQTLEALRQEMAIERVSQLANASRGADWSEPGDR